MARHQFVILTQAVVGREAEFEAWYDDRHIPDVLRVPGVVSAKRFRVDQVHSGTETPPWLSLAIYEIESDTPQAVVAEIRRRARTSDMPLTEAMIGAGTLQVLASPVSQSPRVGLA